MKQLFATIIMVLTMISCHNNNVESVARENLEKVTHSWVESRNNDNTILQKLSVSNVQTILSNDSLCYLSYNVAVTHGGKQEETLLNLAMAKFDFDYAYIIIHKSYETTTPDKFNKWLLEYKEEMKNDMTEEEVMQEITNKLYNTISKEGHKLEN